MRIAVMGAGAVGGYFGARLAAASNDVAFIARGPHLMAMRQEGLTLESPQGNLHIRDALFTDDPDPSRRRRSRPVLRQILRHGRDRRKTDAA